MFLQVSLLIYQILYQLCINYKDYKEIEARSELRKVGWVNRGPKEVKNCKHTRSNLTKNACLQFTELCIAYRTAGIPIRWNTHNIKGILKVNGQSFSDSLSACRSIYLTKDVHSDFGDVLHLSLVHRNNRCVHFIYKPILVFFFI